VVSYQWHDPYLDVTKSNSTNICDPNPSNRNLVSEISKIISRRHNIWRFFTHINIRERAIEEGSFEFFVSLLNEPNDLAMEWRRLKEGLTPYAIETEGATIIKADVNPIAFKRIFLSMRTNFSMKEDFLKICEEVGSQYGMLPEDFRRVETHTDPVVNSIVSEIQSSHAMIQYYGNMANDPNNYDWLHAELLAAKVLNMPVVTILEGESTPSERIKTLGGQAPIRIPISPSRENIISAIEKALRQIHGIK
jgi:hypothetical protein